ncbi:MAG: outer membrane beta-barrel protein [Bacteroidota bacterium]
MFSFQRLVIFLLFVCLFSMLTSAQTRSGKFGIGLGADGTELLGISPNAIMSYDAGLNAFYSITEGVGLRSSMGMGQLGWKSPVTKQNLSTNMMYDNLYVSADFMPNSSLNPFVMAGVGIVMYDPTDSIGHRIQDKTKYSSIDLHYILGGGCDYFINEFWSVTVKGEYVMTNAWHYYGAGPSGKDNNFLRVGLEVRYYFFDQSFITKMLEAVKNRFKKN